jgi:hypothetical protein
MVKVIAGGLAAGIVVFCWGAIAHLVLPIGNMGIRQIPNEDSVIGTIRNAIQEPGFYFFPGMDMSRAPSESEQQAWNAKLKQGPAGVLIIQPQGGEPMSPRQLGTEVATDIVAAILAALLLSQARGNYWGRVAFVALLGIFGFVTISVPYWNWYAFPTDFTTAEAVDQVVGWFLAGLVLAAIVRSPKAPAAAR